MEIRLWSHQAAMIQAPYAHPEIRYFFDIAGYGSGKSFGIVIAMLWLASKYKDILVGVGGDTITRLRKSVLTDFFILANRHSVPYRYNSQQGILSVYGADFFFVNTSQPEQIYAYTFNAFLCDELDELKQEDARAAFQAIVERTRKPFPDGRAPIRMFFTTSQGLKGTYLVMEDLKARGVPYVHVRGRTIENEANDPSYYQDLYAIYNEIERRVYLEGEFANLTTGRVYYGYDESVNRLKEVPFAIEPNDLIRVGQDFNTGYSRGTATVTRNGVIHVCQLWDFGEIGHAPKMIRSTFPSNVIEWYPDASSWEIVTGYTSEVKANGIECRVGTINPSVIDRVFFVNKLFEMRRLVLWPNCGPLSMALKVRQYNDRGDPEKGKGPEAPDHWCDSLEYVVWRIVWRDPGFKDLWDASRAGRRVITDRIVA